jgi:hypothetical protein
MRLLLIAVAASGLLIGLIAVLVMILPKETTRDERGWQLGIDNTIALLQPFTVRDNQITIEGWQEGVGTGEIRYTLVKLNGWGVPTYYGEVYFSGNYLKDSGRFEHTFTHIPNGPGYRLEVFNYGRCLCKGAVYVKG